MQKQFNIVDVASHVILMGYQRASCPTAEVQEPELTIDAAGQTTATCIEPPAVPENLLCASDDGNEMCVGCNCWKLTRDIRHD